MQANLEKNPSQLIETIETIELLESQVEQGLDPDINSLIVLDNQPITTWVDKRINLIERLDSEIEFATKQINFFQTRKKGLELIKEKVREVTKSLIESVTHVKFEGSAKRFAIQKNGGKPPLGWKIDLGSLKNIVKPQDKHHIPPQYLKEVSISVVDVERLEADIRGGVIEIEAVTRLPVGTHLRIR